MNIKEELLKEKIQTLKLVIENNLENETAAFKSRGKKILKAFK